MNRLPIIAANWKMYKTLSEMKDFLEEFLSLIANYNDRQIIIAPNYICLSEMVRLSADSPLEVAAQNMFYEKEGAYTGEVSPLMLKAVGVKWVILGHSERRHIFKEDDELIAKKVKASVDYGLKPIFCIGETLQEREEDKTEVVLRTQLRKGLSLLSESEISMVTVAYEPVWAIGTGKTATLEQIQNAHKFVRDEISTLSTETIAQEIRILYGGSVKPTNAKDILLLEDVDGALVGGASLKVDNFIKIVNFDAS